MPTFWNTCEAFQNVWRESTHCLWGHHAPIRGPCCSVCSFFLVLCQVPGALTLCEHSAVLQLQRRAGAGRGPGTEVGPSLVTEWFLSLGGRAVSTSPISFVPLSSRPSRLLGGTEAREASHLPRVTCSLEKARAVWQSGGQRNGVGRAARGGLYREWARGPHRDEGLWLLRGAGVGPGGRSGDMEGVPGTGGSLDKGGDS